MEELSQRIDDLIDAANALKDSLEIDTEPGQGIYSEVDTEALAEVEGAMLDIQEEIEMGGM